MSQSWSTSNLKVPEPYRVPSPAQIDGLKQLLKSFFALCLALSLSFLYLADTGISQTSERATNSTSDDVLEGQIKAIFEGQSSKHYKSFAALRHDLLELIAGAQERVWLASTFLTDGELASALYLAQYRKVDTSVLLEGQRARDPMSRLNYLKRHGIPVYLMAVAGSLGAPSVLIVDDRVFQIDGELDTRAQYRRFQLTRLQPAIAKQVTTKFQQISGRRLQVVPIPRPTVGSPGGRVPKDQVNQPKDKAPSTDEAYHYGGGPDRHPSSPAAYNPTRRHPMGKTTTYRRQIIL